MSLNGNSEVPGGTGGGKAPGLLKLFLEERQGTPSHHGRVAHPLVIQLPGAHEVTHYPVDVISGFGPITVPGLIGVMLLRGRMSQAGDRQSVRLGTRVSVRGDLGGRGPINKKK